MNQNEKKPLVILTGPTAVGKTELSINLAKRINGEIISADSMQIYKYMWAIGTGRVATTQQAQEVCNVIRNNIRDIYGKQVAETVRILYGGSVNADNALALFSEPDIDGGLVGGASLRPEFAKIVNYNK